MAGWQEEAAGQFSMADLKDHFKRLPVVDGCQRVEKGGMTSFKGNQILWMLLADLSSAEYVVKNFTSP